MYAVVETGGKQLRVSEGEVVWVERLDAAVGDQVVFDRVLCVAGDGRFVPGNPLVPGARVVGTVLAQARGRKVVVFKYKAKVNYRRKTGHRQALTVVRIGSISTAGDGPTPEAAAGEAAPAAAVEGAAVPEDGGGAATGA